MQAEVRAPVWGEALLAELGGMGQAAAASSSHNQSQ